MEMWPHLVPHLSSARYPQGAVVSPRVHLLQPVPLEGRPVGGGGGAGVGLGSL